MATILSMIQDVCRRNGLPVPPAIQGTQDAQTQQYISVVNECLEDIVNRFDWQALRKQATFITVAGESQGPIDALAPIGFKSIVNETLYDRSLRLPLFGPLSDAQWAALKALPNSGPNYQYRIRGNELLSVPDAAAGHTWAFEYVSNWAVFDAASGSTKQFYTADSDTIILNEACFKACFEWSWKAHKGLDYAEAFKRYEEFVVDARSKDTTPPRVNASNVGTSIRPGIWVPAGNWMQP